MSKKNNQKRQLQTPMVSIIIVNWNGKKWLKKCLDALLDQTYTNYEIILVDNASADDSVDFVEKLYPQVKLIVNSENLGFAGGNNVGYAHSRGDLIFLLNNDTYVKPDFLQQFIDGSNMFENFGSIQPKLLLMDKPQYLDNVGSYWTSSTFLYHYGYGKKENLKKYNVIKPFFSNKGAAMLLRREVIEELGLFDDDFWCYYEETDLCHRLWLAGYECWYYPGAAVYHAMGGTSLLFPNEYIQFHNFKNKLLSFLKNFQARSLLYIVPTYLILNIGLGLLWLVRGRAKHFWALCKAIAWNIRHLPATLDKRRYIQAKRRVSDRQLFSTLKKNPNVDYYRDLVNGTLDQYVDI